METSEALYIKQYWLSLNSQGQSGDWKLHKKNNFLSFYCNFSISFLL